MRRRVWRRFKPRHPRRSGSIILDEYDPHEEMPATMDRLLADAEHKIYRRLPRRPHVYKLNEHIDEFRAHARASNQIVDWLAAVLIQAPRASEAQVQMDRHKRGYHNKKSRLYELIDFNDTFVDTVLVLDDTLRHGFADKLKMSIDRVCQFAQTTSFTDLQWDAITRGLGREIAVFSAGIENGFDAWMTSRAQDAMGIDMQIRDPESKRYINLDVKTPSSFRHRLEELLREGRITQRALLIADDVGYIEIHNGRGDARVPTILLCILPERSGEIENFRFVDSGPIRDMLNRLIREHGIDDDCYGSVGECRSS